MFIYYTADPGTMGIPLSQLFLTFRAIFPIRVPHDVSPSSSQPPFSVIIETRYLNVSTCFNLSFFLSYIHASPLTSRVHTLASVFFAFTLRSFVSKAFCYSPTRLCKSSSISANIPSHMHTVGPMILIS